jgi:prepilin-type N-terminal cleavage/methylation domain-containing protein
MKFFRLQNKQGFTLIEVLVYIVILLVVSMAGITLLLSLNDFADQYRLETALYRSGTNVMEQVMVAVREADQYDAGTSVINNATGTLAVTKGGVTTSFVRSLDELHYYVEGVDRGNMLQSDVSMTDFMIYKYDTADGSFVRIRLTLTATVDGVTKTITLYDGAVIRGDL